MKLEKSNNGDWATFSNEPTALYRYQLFRHLTEKLPVLDDHKPTKVCAFIGLNPSTATHEVDDPTIRREKHFALQLGCDAFVKVNIFAFRSTSPLGLYSCDDPIGPENSVAIENAIATAYSYRAPVICAWGAAHLPKIQRLVDAQVAFVQAEADRVRVKLNCLGRTASGMPRHPLYLKGNSRLEVWP